MTQWQDGYGVKIEDLDAEEFSCSGQPLDPVSVEDAFIRLRTALTQSPEVALNELVQLAVSHCHADSAGISLEEQDSTGELRFRWVAVAGSFSRYLNGTTPRFYSPCGTTLDRGVPQRYRVWEPYYNFLGVTAQPIRDGLLIPWHGAERRGTLWLVSHRSNDAFSASDFAFATKLADFVSESMKIQPDQLGF